MKPTLHNRNTSKSTIKLAIIFVVLCISCKNADYHVLKLKNNQDIIPEGIAVFGKNIFLSSIYENKIISLPIDEQRAVNFIKKNEYGFRSGGGMAVYGKQLFALSNDLHSMPNSSSLYIFDIDKRTLVKEYTLNDGQSHFLNDLVVTSSGQCFITDSRQHKILRLDIGSNTFTDFISDTSELSRPNGITLSDDNKTLFVASFNKGLRIIDIVSAKILNPANSETKGIEGIKYYNGTIYAIRNSSTNQKENGLLKILLEDNESEIKQVENLLPGDPIMNIPKALSIHDNKIYLLANSRINNLGQESMNIINRNRSNDTYILTLKLKNKARNTLLKWGTY